MLRNAKELKSISLNALKKYKKISTESIPSSLVKRAFSPASYKVKKKLKAGLQCYLADAGDASAKLIFQWLDEAIEYAKEDPFDVLTENGRVRFYNHRIFFQTLSGMILDESTVASHELLNLMIARLPKSVVDIFGWLAPIDSTVNTDNELIEKLHTESSKDTVVIALRIESKDISVMAYVEADKTVLLRILDSPVFSPFVEIDQAEKKPIQMTVPCVVGSSVITTNMLRSLEVGDVLMLQETNIDVDGRVKILIGDRELHVMSSNASPVNFEISGDKNDAAGDSLMDIESENFST